jgi:hypothetical protein
MIGNLFGLMAGARQIAKPAAISPVSPRDVKPFARMRLGSIVLPAWLWDEAERRGLDLSGYVKERRLGSYDADIIEGRR